MPILIDGNNLLHSLAPNTRSRADVRRHTLELTRFESIRVTVVFDGPPPSGAAKREDLGNVSIVYSCGRSADDVIISFLPKGKPSADWVVVSDDRGLARRAREAGAAVRTLAEWRGRRGRRPAPPSLPRTEAKLSSNEISEWEAYFSSPRDDRD